MVKVTKSLVEDTILAISKLHDSIIEKSGGEQGIRDKGGLYNSISRILSFQEKNSNKPFSVGAFIFKELARKHHFVDGNKRTAYVFAKILLLKMSFYLKVKYKDATPFIMKIAEHNSTVSFKEIAEWIKSNSVKISEKDIEKYLKELISEFNNEKQSRGENEKN